MSSRMIGVEIGSSTLKMAVCIGGVIKKTAVKRMPDDLVREGKVTSTGAMSNFLKEMRKEFGIPGGACALVLPSQTVISHRVTMPSMSHEELMLNLPFEFRDFVGKDGAKYYYDYSVMSVQEGVMELYAAAVRIDVIEEYYEVMKKAGLNLKMAMPSEMAILNLVNILPNSPKACCVVDLGHSYTKVYIYANGNYVMGKEIELGGSLIDETIASDQKVDPYVARTRKEANMNKVLTSDVCTEAYQTLAIEVMKILNFYTYSAAFGDDKIDDIYFCGGSSVIEPLRTAIVKATGTTLHHAQRLIPGAVVSDETLCCALAAGAAVQKLNTKGGNKA